MRGHRPRPGTRGTGVAVAGVTLALLLGACAPMFGFVPLSLTCSAAGGEAPFDSRYPPSGALDGGRLPAAAPVAREAVAEAPIGP